MGGRKISEKENKGGRKRRREKNNEINRVWDRDRMRDRQTDRHRETDWGTAWHRKRKREEEKKTEWGREENRKRKREVWLAHEENEGETVEDRETLKLLKNSISPSFARESHNLYLDDTMNLFISLHHWIDWLKHYYVHSISVVSYFSFFYYSFDLMFFLHSVFLSVFIMFSLMNGSIWNTIWIAWLLPIFWATLRFLITSLLFSVFS